MKLSLAAALALLSIAASSCSGSGSSPRSAPAAPADPLAAMRAAIVELQGRAEHDARRVEVQHILIGVKGAPRMRATRSRDEAERCAADLYARLVAGADMTELMRQFSDDPGPGVYSMTVATRSSMVPGFGDVAWRLEVGEVGVAPHHPVDSPFGWHLMKRLK